MHRGSLREQHVASNDGSRIWRAHNRTENKTNKHKNRIIIYKNTGHVTQIYKHCRQKKQNNK